MSAPDETLVEWEFLLNEIFANRPCLVRSMEAYPKEESMSLQPATFTLDAFGERYFHGFSNGGLWNGFACPFFPLEEGLRLSIVNNATDYCGRLEYDAIRDAFVFDEHADGGDNALPSVPVVFWPEFVDGQKVYGIGASAWCWHEVDADDDLARFSRHLSHELAELRRLGTSVPDRAFDMAADIAVIEDYLSMGVSDAADLIIQLAQVEQAPAVATPPASILPAIGGFLRIVVLPVVALDENSEPIAMADLQHIAVARREPTDGDDPFVSAWGVYGESADSVVTHLADSPTREIAEAIAFALNGSLPPRPVPKDSFILTVMPGYVPVRGSAKTDLMYAVEQAGIPTCVEERQ